MYIYKKMLIQMGAWETAVTHLGGLEIGDSVAELLKKCHMGSVNQVCAS